MDTATKITLGVALYGAGLSTYQWMQSRKDAQRVARVTVYQGAFTDGRGKGPPMIYIEVANPGNKTITVQQPMIRFPDGRGLGFHVCGKNVDFPYDLPEGKSCRIWFDRTELAGIIFDDIRKKKVKIRGIVKDGVGVEFISKPFVVRKEWIKA